MMTGICVNIGTGNCSLPDGTMQLLESMLTNHQWGFVAFTWEKLLEILKISTMYMSLKITYLILQLHSRWVNLLMLQGHNWQIAVYADIILCLLLPPMNYSWNIICDQTMLFKATRNLGMARYREILYYSYNHKYGYCWLMLWIRTSAWFHYDSLQRYGDSH